MKPAAKPLDPASAAEKEKANRAKKAAEKAEKKRLKEEKAEAKRLADKEKKKEVHEKQLKERSAKRVSAACLWWQCRALLRVGQCRPPFRRSLPNTPRSCRRRCVQLCAV